MPILTRDEFIKRVNERIGNDTSDEAIHFVEDMLDTYSDLETRAANNSNDWEQKYKDNDAAWRKKYTSRFFSGGPIGNGESIQKTEETEEYKPEEVSVEDLFEEKQG